MPTLSAVKHSKLANILAGAPMILIWGAAVVLGMWSLVHYQMTPAAQAMAAPTRWPGEVSIARDAGRLSLVMTLHPQCPCSRASLHELEELMARSTGRVDAHVLFVQPAAAPADWSHSDNWRLASAIPGVKLSIDKDGKDSAAFGASTSGQVMVYDKAGILRFSGGITDGRGHEGDNAGLSAILSLVRDEKSPISNTPVYGCSLGICWRAK